MIHQSHSVVFTQRSWKHMSTRRSTWECLQQLYSRLPKLGSNQHVIDEWINKLWSIWTVNYYSALKRNEPPSHEKTWKKLTCVLLSERSQSEKATYCMASTTWQFGKDKTKEALKNYWFPGIKEGGRGTPLTNGSPLVKNMPCNAAKLSRSYKALSHNSLPITHTASSGIKIPYQRDS